MSVESRVLTLEARFALHMGQRELGELLGVSKRTVQRWDAGQSEPGSLDLARLAKVVHPRNAQLAGKIAAAAGTSLEKLGVMPPAAPSPQAAPHSREAAVNPSPPLSRHLVDVVVCAAAEALNAPPPVARPVLLAAFRRAREMGLRVEDVEEALSEAAGGRSETAKRKRRR